MLAILTGWAMLFVISIIAVDQMGATAAIDTFFADLSHPWRRQFNTDFAIHLLLFASWIIWRSRSKPIGVLFGFLAVGLGGVFSLAFILAELVRHKGDVRRVLLGCHACDGPR